MNIQEYLREQLNVPVVGRLGASVGLKAPQSTSIADEVLPAQLDALNRLAATPDGAQKLWNLAHDRVPSGTVNQLTSNPQELAKLQPAGANLLPEVMGSSLNTEVARVAASSGASEVQVCQMMELLLPLLLGLIAGRARSEKLTPATLATLFGGAAVAGVAGTVVGTVSSTPEVVTVQGAPVRAAPVAPLARPVQPVREESRRRELGWLWLLPLLLVLGLGGCFLLGNKGVAGLTLTGPTSAASVQAGAPITFTGSGRAGGTVTVSENGAAVGTGQVSSDGQYTVTVPAPAVGTHSYTVSETGTDVKLGRAVSVLAAAAPVTPAATTPTASAAPASGKLAITAPAGESPVPAGSLVLRGNGPASTDLSVAEDGNSLGQAKTDASGAWTFTVPSPSAGVHTYTATAPTATGAQAAILRLTVAAGTAQSGTCTKDFSLSLKDGQSVKQPFRFGGVGSGKSYVVTVSRPDRRIGQKTLPLDASCGWSYTSRPGAGKITYTLRETGQQTVAAKVALNVTR